MIHSNSDIFESGSVSEKCYQMLQVASWVHWWLAAFPGIPHTALAGASSGQRYVPCSLSSGHRMHFLWGMWLFRMVFLLFIQNCRVSFDLLGRKKDGRSPHLYLWRISPQIGQWGQTIVLEVGFRKNDLLVAEVPRT